MPKAAVEIIIDSVSDYHAWKITPSGLIEVNPKTDQPLKPVIKDSVANAISIKEID